MIPIVTVLMPVYNSEKYLREAIDSILAQTFTNFEFLIINDGSTDDSVNIVESYKDERIRFVHNEKNQGLIFTLNRGFDLARGLYIARMDSDDISRSDRLAKQVKFMDNNPDISVCGTWAEKIDSKGTCIGKMKTPLGSSIEKFIWRPTPLIHPTVFFRRDMVQGYYYNESFIHVEDYELWLRMSKNLRFHNIAECLLYYREHSSNVSSSNRSTQLENSYRVFLSHSSIVDISYEEFLSLIGCHSYISPIKRSHKFMSIAQTYNIRFMEILIDNLKYLKRWLKQCCKY